MTEPANLSEKMYGVPPPVNAVYRIEVAHTPALSYNYCASIFRLSDEVEVGARYADRADFALQKAQETIYELSLQLPTATVYADEEGRVVA